MGHTYPKKTQHKTFFLKLKFKFNWMSSGFFVVVFFSESGSEHLIVHFKMVSMVYFMLHEFYHSHKSRNPTLNRLSRRSFRVEPPGTIMKANLE